MDETWKVNVMWGSIQDGVWKPVTNLKMSADEQWRQNRESGFDMPSVPRLPASVAGRPERILI
jgi:hypothetical protein